MDKLKRSKDRKVTNLVNAAGTTAQGANSFGLPSGKAFSCPGQTPFCEKICYAGKLEKIYKDVSAILLHNWELLKDANWETMVALIKDMVMDFYTETTAAIAKGKPATLDFRIHWDGDFFSETYADAWAWVAKAFPEVRFWVYTRSFTADLNVLPFITGIDNMVVYLSADPDNIGLANEMADRYNVNIATVADTFADAKATIVDTSRKTYPCPENGKRIPLISTKGSACIACGICPAGRGDVLFSVKKR